MVRCKSVPAFEALTPMTSATSAFERPAWNFSAISSRSRGLSSASAARTVVRRSATSVSSSGAGVSRSSGSTASVAWRRRRRSSSSAALRAMPNSHARSLPRRALNERRRR